jgi:hypothetical protein
LPLTLAEASIVIELTSTTSRLLQLDEVWTATAALGRPSEDYVDQGEWIGQVEALVDEMRGLLTEVGSHSGILASVAEAHADEAEETLNGLLWGDLLSPEDRSTLRWWSGRHGGFPAMATTSASVLADVDEELAALGRQLELLRSGEAATGDLTKKFRCGAAQQLLVGGVLLVPGVAGGGVALGLAAGVAAGAMVASTGGLGALVLIGGALWWAKRHHC